MRIIKPTSKHHMNAAWLRSELFRIKSELTLEQILLVEQPNFDNPNDNARRENLLFKVYGRSAILDKIPNDLDWFEAEIEIDDLSKIYIVPVFDWFMDTGGNFQLTNVPHYLSPKRGYRLKSIDPPTEVHHFKKIDEMSKNSNLNSDDIVIISSSQNKSPFTIIDGTHRASLLIKNDKLVGIKVFLGVGNMQDCFWSVERRDFTEHLSGLQQLVNDGALW